MAGFRSSLKVIITAELTGTLTAAVAGERPKMDGGVVSAASVVKLQV